jgi:transcription initiation factor TFIIIB Brf1 subunit/transcription initiation factor TFIIB
MSSSSYSYEGLGYREYFSSLPCDNCKKKSDPVIDYYSGDVLCPNCGLVRSHHLIDTRSEIIIYAEDREKGDKSLRASTFDTMNSYGGDDVVFERPSSSSAMSSSSSGGRVSEDHLTMLKRAQQHVHGKKHSSVYQQLISLHDFASKLMLTNDVQVRSFSSLI